MPGLLLGLSRRPDHFVAHPLDQDHSLTYSGVAGHILYIGEDHEDQTNPGSIGNLCDAGISDTGRRGIASASGI